jgi:hypothetical protein
MAEVAHEVTAIDRQLQRHHLPSMSDLRKPVSTLIRLIWGPGGEIASTFDNPGSVKLGSCKLIEEIMIGEDKLIHFSGVAMGEACTIVLRGASVSLSTFPALVNILFACAGASKTGKLQRRACLNKPFTLGR